MDKQGLIFDIDSKYILKYIFNYIPKINFEQKIFSYSKCFQNKLKIKYTYCLNKYLDAFGFDINKYLFI